jgi:hypothetical protein
VLSPQGAGNGPTTYRNLVIHGGISIGGSSSTVDVLILVSRFEVIGHLGVQFFSCLLSWAAAAARAASLATTASAGADSLSSVLLLIVRSRLGLGLRLRDTFSKRLRCRNNLSSLGSADDDFDLSRKLASIASNRKTNLISLPS